MKKSLFAKIGIGLLTIIAALIMVYFLLPETVFKIARGASRSIAGLTEKYVQVDDHRIAYLEGGKGDVILLIHGYAVNKDNWTRFARYLTTHYRVIVPDIAGFGESSRLPDASYDIQSQVDRLNRFTEILKLDRFNMAGNSMGGMIAGIYAAQHPNKVISLALLAPYGIKSPVKSELEKMFERGINPLLIRNSDDYERMLTMVFVKVPVIPYPVKKEMMEQAIRTRPFNEKILGDMMKKRLSFEPFLPEIQAPTLILWGDSDKLLHVSSVSILEKGLKTYQTVIMKDCGHAPMLERPEETANHYLRFITTISKKEALL
jgi:abhydrolase domain-containing protein 6